MDILLTNLMSGGLGAVLATSASTWATLRTQRKELLRSVYVDWQAKFHEALAAADEVFLWSEVAVPWFEMERVEPRATQSDERAQYVTQGREKIVNAHRDAQDKASAAERALRASFGRIKVTEGNATRVASFRSLSDRACPSRSVPPEAAPTALDTFKVLRETGAAFAAHREVLLGDCEACMEETIVRHHLRSPWR